MSEKIQEVVEQEAVQEEVSAEERAAKKDPDGLVSEEAKQKIESEPMHYKYADLVISCSNCGHDTVLDKNVEGGISFRPLATTSKAHFGIACSNCGWSLLMHFKPAENPPEDQLIETMEEAEKRIRAEMVERAKEEKKQENKEETKGDK